MANPSTAFGDYTFDFSNVKGATAKKRQIGLNDLQNNWVVVSMTLSFLIIFVKTPSF